MKKIFLQLTFSLLTTITFAQSNINLNEKAPNINITDWVLNKPADTNLQGKYIVLEFWATWCGPCIAAVPHMNELQSKFDDPELLFLSITDEAVAKINRTLERVDFHSSVVTDLSKQTQINFGDGKRGLDAYPMTVLIDKEGIIKWIGHPELLTEGILIDFLDNNLEAKNHLKKEVEPVNDGVANNEEKEEKKESLQAEFMSIISDKEKVLFFDLRKATGSETTSMKLGRKAFLLSQVSIKEIYDELFGIKIEPSVSLDTTQYTLIYKNLTDTDESFTQLEKLLLSALNLEMQAKVETVTKYIVKVEDASLLKPALDKSFTAKSEADDKIILSNYKIARMIEEMGKVLNVPLQFEGEDDSTYDFIIKNDDLKSLQKSLGSYGLSVQKSEVQMEQFYLVQKEQPVK